MAPTRGAADELLGVRRDGSEASDPIDGALSRWRAVRVLTWNVAGRVARQPEQAAVVGAAGADVVALQEVTPRTLPLWRDALRDAGFGGCETALGDARAAGRRALGVLTAAREPLGRLDGPDVPWPERVLRCAVGDVEVINVHSPISPAPDLAKVRTHEAVAAHLLACADGLASCAAISTPRGASWPTAT